MNDTALNPSRRAADSRSAAIRTKVLLAMRSIRNEIESSKNAHNHQQSITAKEVARRANIHPTTFHTRKQRLLGARVKKWVRLLNARTIELEAKPNRRSIEDRLADWRQRYMGLAQAHRDTELDLHQAQAELADAHLELAELKRLNAGLSAELKQLSALRIIPFSKKHRDDF